MYSFNSENSHERDARLTFDELNHIYTLSDTGEELLSVTTLVDDCFEKFDADYWAARKAPSMGMTPDELKTLWAAKGREAADLGTEMHARIERYFLGDDCGADDTSYRLFKAFASVACLCPYRTEWRIYFEEYGIAGTLDFICRDPFTGEFIIYDWKRSDRIIRNGRVEDRSPFGKRACAPLSHLSDTTYAHYSLQVSIYRYILQKKYGINVARGYLGIFHPSYTRPYVVEVPYLRSEVELILKHRIISCESICMP